MGYRSDCKLLVRTETYDKMRAEYEALSQREEYGTFWEYMDAIDSVMLITIKGNTYVLAEWDSVKWYDNAIIYFLRDMGNDTYFEFMRIGEDCDDVEYINNVPDDESYRLYCRREICVEDMF